MTRKNLGAAIAIAVAGIAVGALFGQPGSGRAAGTAPVSSAPPTISGTAQQGQTLSASKGGWSNSPTAFTYAWSQCDANGDSCAAIVGGTSDTYAVTQADAGDTLRIAVTATNADGATEFVSAQTAAVPGANGCPAGTGTINVADLDKPARLDITKASISPKLVTLGTHTIQLHFTVTACNGRPVSGSSVFATPIPYNQFAGATKLTAADGTVTITETRRRGFPARNRHQHLLAVFTRASKQGDPILGGVSTRRTVAFQVNLP